MRLISNANLFRIVSSFVRTKTIVNPNHTRLNLVPKKNRSTFERKMKDIFKDYRSIGTLINGLLIRFVRPTLMDLEIGMDFQSICYYLCAYKEKRTHSYYRFSIIISLFTTHNNCF